MPKKNVDAPLVYDAKTGKWVPATRAICDDCGRLDYIALRGANRQKICFPCYEKREARWLRQ